MKKLNGLPIWLSVCAIWLTAGSIPANAGLLCNHTDGCGDGCCNSCGVDECGESCCGLFGCGGISLLATPGCPSSGLVQPSDHCFDDFISPMINFVFFEDPRNVTEVRPIFVNHWVPGSIGSPGVNAGGTIQLYALQFRAALTDRLSLIAVKD